MKVCPKCRSVSTRPHGGKHLCLGCGFLGAMRELSDERDTDAQHRLDGRDYVGGGYQRRAVRYDE